MCVWLLISWTVREHNMQDRTKVQDASKVYCDLKKRAMQEQAARAAGVILGRF